MNALSCVQMPHEHAHGHSHAIGVADRSREGLRVVLASLAVLLATAAAQAAIFATTGSVALLADLVHNAGDALTAIPLAIAFLLRSARAERGAGWFVVGAILVSALVAAAEGVHRLIDPQDLRHLGALAGAGVVGFLGNEVAARVRLSGGRRLSSPALIADGYHARTDGYVSLAVVASAGCAAIGFPLGDPLIGLAIACVILRITVLSIRTIRDAPPE